MTKLQRMREHVLESTYDRLVDEGRSHAEAITVATRVANATVNKHRAALARGKTTCGTRRGRTTCRTSRGPELVTRGGSRRQWYPGKKTGKKETYACLAHGRRFKTKTGWLSHMRSSAHGKRLSKPCCAGCAEGRGCDGKGARRS